MPAPGQKLILMHAERASKGGWGQPEEYRIPGRSPAKPLVESRQSERNGENRPSIPQWRAGVQGKDFLNHGTVVVPCQIPKQNPTKWL